MPSVRQLFSTYSHSRTLLRVAAVFVAAGTSALACSSPEETTACTCKVQGSEWACGTTSCIDGTSWSCGAAAEITEGEACGGETDASLDTSTQDTGARDTGVPDTGVPDTGVPDTSVPDSGPADAGTDAGACVSGIPKASVFLDALDGAPTQTAILEPNFYYLVRGPSDAAVKVRSVPLGGGAKTEVRTLRSTDASKPALAAFGTSVYYTDKDSVGTKVSILNRLANGAGAPQALYTLPLPTGADPAVGRVIASTGAKLVVNYDSGSAAGVQLVGLTTATASTMAGTAGPAFMYTVVAADPSFVATYRGGVSGNDRKVRVYKATTPYSLVATTAAATNINEYRAGQLAVAGDLVAWIDTTSSRNTLTTCSIAAGCVPTVVPFQANFVSSAIAIANGRLYFTYKINACDADDFALASCSLATLANGTCVPQIHAAHFGLLGTRVLTVGTDVAFVTAQDGNTYRIPL